MGYHTSAGIAEEKLSAWLADAAKKYGCFKDGRVNYTKADIAPIVMVTVFCQGKILLVKRSYGLADADGYWSTVNGYIDENEPVKQLAAQELKEEIDLKVAPNDIKVAGSYTLQNPAEKRKYIVFPCLASLDQQPDITLNQENTAFGWIDREDLPKYHILDDLPLAIDTALKLL